MADADSVTFCLSKGLSAPVGSIICGSKEFIYHARRIRKALGGGMRQAGIIAAPGIISLDKMIDQIREDHNNANILALGARMTNYEEMISIINKWLDTEFEGGRHQNRIDKIEMQ